MQKVLQIFNLATFTAFFFVLSFISSVFADDQPQWGQKFSRNMVSEEVGLPEGFNIQTGQNIKWSASLGTQNYSTPTIANGKVLIGANNDSPRDQRHRGDRGVLLCLNEEDGSLLWQLVVPREETNDRYLDWPRVGLASPPTVEGDRVYTLTNRFEVVCLDLNGQANGNDGPYYDEGSHMTTSTTPAMEVTSIDADIIWIIDLADDIGIYQHDAAHASILIDGPYLYLNSCNGVDNTHGRIRRPDAPSLIVLDKENGRLVAKDDENIGPHIFHSTWSSPALGEVNGQRMIFFAGGNGVCYGFEALQHDAITSDQVQMLKRVWMFDCDPNAPKENIHSYYGNSRVGPSSINSMPVFYDNKLYVTVGGDPQQRTKNQAWLKCIDTTKTGDITNTGQIWSYQFNTRCCCTPAIYDGMVFVADCRGIVHCIDAQTGSEYWTHQTTGEIWASAYVADGKVYVGTRRSDFWIFDASREKKLISSTRLDNTTTSTAVAANGTLYVATMSTLYAIAESDAQ